MPHEEGEPAEPWNPIVSQVNALTTCLGLTLGFLRAKGLANETEISELFRLADDLLPEESGLDGANTLRIIRTVADNVTGHPG